MPISYDRLIEIAEPASVAWPRMRRVRRQAEHAVQLAVRGGQRLVGRALHGSQRVGYIGSFGGRNVGDYACYLGARRLLGERVTVWGPSWNERRLDRVGLSGSRLFGDVLLGGGTLIDPWRVGHVRTALDQGLALSAFGTGVGSKGWDESDARWLKAWPEMLERFDSIGLRGPRSLETLSRLGVERCEVVGDLALALTSPRPTPAPPRRRLALNLTMPRRAEYSEHLRAGMAALERAIGRLVEAGWEIWPFAMELRDQRVLGEVLSDVGWRGQGIWFRRDPMDLIQRLAACSVTLAVRLHGAVLSCCAGTPTVAVGYELKSEDFMESMQLMAWHYRIDNLNADALVESVNRAAEDRGLGRFVWEQARNWKGVQEQFAAKCIGQRRDVQVAFDDVRVASESATC